MSGNNTTLVQIKHLTAAAVQGEGLTIAHGLTTALGVMATIATVSGADPLAAGAGAIVHAKINGANIEYDIFHDDGVASSVNARVDFLVFGS